MNIVIAGCGKIGAAVLKSMLVEGHDVTVIDSSKDRVKEILNTYDVMAACGNAVDHDVLKAAGAETADVFIAMTGSDEQNMLACFFARRLGSRNTIARIRDAEYDGKAGTFIKQQMELSMTVNPEQLASKEIFNILRLPSAVKVETFANGIFEMVELRLKDDSPLCDLTLAAIRGRIKGTYLICTVQRNDEVYIPDGSFILRAGDRITLAAPPAEIQRILKQLDLLKKQARSIMILGASRMAYYLGKRLSFIGSRIKIIEQDQARADKMSEQLPTCSVIRADGADQEVLLEEGLRSVDAFIALTGMDEENILLSAFAASVNVPKVITKISRTQLTGIANTLGLDTVIDPKTAAADLVTRYVRALRNSRGGKIEALYNVADGAAEVLTFTAADDFAGADTPLKTLQLKPHVLIAGVMRGRKPLVPTGDDVILPGDRVIVIARGKLLNDLSDILK